MLQNFQQNEFRASFYAFKEALETQGIDTTNALIMQYIVRIHTALVNGKTKYTLDLGVGNTSSLPVEKKLQKSDIFMAVYGRMAVQKYDPASPDFSQPKFTYADPIYFTPAIAVQLNKIFEGSVSLKTGVNTRIDQLDGNFFKFVPGEGFAGTVAAPTDYPKHGGSAEEKGYVNLGSYPIILGETENKLEIELAPGAIASIAESGATSNNLVFELQGWVYRGIASGGQCTTF